VLKVLSFIPITRGLIDELEDFRRLYKNAWVSIIGLLTLTRYIQSVNNDVLEDVKEKKSRNT
jgi:hypothetical protein